VSVVDAEGQRVDESPVRGARRFYIRHPGLRCCLCGDFLRVAELAQYVGTGSSSKIRHAFCGGATSTSRATPRNPVKT
jgi:hypothetical protein